MLGQRERLGWLATIGLLMLASGRVVLKMRELRALGTVRLILVPTADMSADMLTKPLDDRTFHKHRREVMNLPA